MSRINTVYIADNRKASNALRTLVKREKKSFSVLGENCQRNVTNQAAGPAIEKARRPNIERRCRGTNYTNS